MNAEHKSEPSSPTTRLRAGWSRLRRGVEEVTPVMSMIMVLTVMFAAVFVIQGQSKLNATVDCFSDYTRSYDEAQGPRVKATGRLDADLIINDEDWVKWVKQVLALFNPRTSDPDTFRALTQTLLDSTQGVRDSRINLQDVRRANPYPDPCEVE